MGGGSSASGVGVSHSRWLDVGLCVELGIQPQGPGFYGLNSGRLCFSATLEDIVFYELGKYISFFFFKRQSKFIPHPGFSRSSWLEK